MHISSMICEPGVNTATHTSRSSDFGKSTMNTTKNASWEDYYLLEDYGNDTFCNVTVLWLLLRHIKVKTMTDVSLLNLALSDLLVALSLPLWIYSSQNLTSCKVITAAYQLGLYSGTLFVTLMSVDRYLAIVRAVAAIQTRTLRYGVIVSIIIWVVSVTMAIPQVIFASLEIEPRDENFQCQPLYPEDTVQFWKLRRNFSENTIGLFVCLPIMIFCYVKILLVLSKSRNSNKHKAVKLIFIIVCMFVICWVPYNVAVFLQTVEIFGIYLTANPCTSSENISSAIFYSEIIALSHCCVNPVIYAFVGEKFRKSLRKVLTRYLGSTHESSHRETTEKETSNTPVRSEY
ncbi:C-C chemokine receptor type 3-like isoform 2-T2 [Pholidichthys leucotaenia]